MSVRGLSVCIMKGAMTLLSLLQEIRSKLRSVCKKGGLLKKVCKVFVKSHLEELVEELKSDDDATTICVNVKACK